MFKEEAETRPTRVDVKSIKETIQSLALEIWLEKRDKVEGVDWLVDGRLMAQLDALSESQLSRVERILVIVVKMLSGKRYMPVRSA